MVEGFLKLRLGLGFDFWVLDLDFSGFGFIMLHQTLLEIVFSPLC